MTAIAPQGTSFPNAIHTAGIVLINLNVSDKRLVPQGIQWVPDTPLESKPKHEPGRKLFKHLNVDTSEILQDLVAGNFVPMELKAIERRHNFRVIGILVRRDLLENGTGGRFSLSQQMKLEQMLDSNIWDVSAYRNPGENGGNYSLECGNPEPEMSSSDILCVDEGEALTVVRSRH